VVRERPFELFASNREQTNNYFASIKNRSQVEDQSQLLTVKAAHALYSSTDRVAGGEKGV
jgi:hypothetical protein